MAFLKQGKNRQKHKVLCNDGLQDCLQDSSTEKVKYLLAAERNERKRNKLVKGIAEWEAALIHDMNIIKADGPEKLVDLFQSEAKEAASFQIVENQATLVVSSSYCPKCNTNPRPRKPKYTYVAGL